MEDLTQKARLKNGLIVFVEKTITKTGQTRYSHRCHRMRCNVAVAKKYLID